MSLREAEGFYAVHKERPFFGELTEFMSSGPTVVQVLEGENAIAKNREIMGATNPADAAEGTIRKVYRAVDRRELGARLRRPGNRRRRKSPTGSPRPKSSAETEARRVGETRRRGDVRASLSLARA